MTHSPIARAFSWREAAIVFVAGLAARLWLIFSYPVIFGGDSVVRLANEDRVLLSYQLPLLQAAIHFLSKLSSDPLLIRCFMAFVGAAAGWAFYAMASTLLERPVAFQTALLFVSSPFVLAFSIVPYQEILMLAGLFGAFYLAFTRNWAFASLALGLACLTRYEAWLACPVIAIFFLLESGWSPREIVKAAVLFGWAPLAWIALHRGLTPAGTFAAETTFTFERFYRYVYLGWITVKNTPVPVLLLALFGCRVFWKQGLLRERRYQSLAAFLALFLGAVLLSAHGERDQPERFVTAREAHILLAAAVLMAGVGLRRIHRFRWVLVVVSVFAGLWMAQRFVANETSQPAFAISYQAARYLDQHVGREDHVVVLARAIPEDQLSRYLDKAEESGGLAARDKALDILLDLDPSPPNYQRILVHSRLTKRQILSVASLPARLVPSSHAERKIGPAKPDWVVVWSDFKPTNEWEERLENEVEEKQPQQAFEQGELRVLIYHLQ